MPKMRNLGYIHVPVVQLSRNLACMLLKIIKPIETLSLWKVQFLYAGDALHAKTEEPWVYTCSCGHNVLKFDMYINQGVMK